MTHLYLTLLSFASLITYTRGKITCMIGQARNDTRYLIPYTRYISLITEEAPFKCSEAICFCVFFSLYQHVRRHCIGNNIDLSLILCIQQTYFFNIYIFAVVWTTYWMRKSILASKLHLCITFKHYTNTYIIFKITLLVFMKQS